MKVATAHTIKHANRTGFYRIAFRLPAAGNRLNGAWIERVVDSATAVRFAQRHNIELPKAAA